MLRAQGYDNGAAQGVKTAVGKKQQAPMTETQ